MTNLEDAVSSVSRALEQAERITGLLLNRAWVGISEVTSSLKNLEGWCWQTDGEIERRRRALIEAARTVGHRRIMRSSMLFQKVLLLMVSVE